MLELDLVQTVAFAGVVLFAGHGVRRLFPLLARQNIPAPVVGGLLVAAAELAARRAGTPLLRLDTTLQTPLMLAFFTSIGYGASLSLLRAGGPQMVLLFAAASVFAVVQNLVGMALTLPFGVSPLLGVLAGATTLAGGPATGLAFAPLFESAGVEGAATLAVTAAMTGIVMGGVVGGPVATWLVRRHRLRTAEGEPGAAPGPLADAPAGTPAATPAHDLLKSVVAILVAMWIGSEISAWLSSLGVTLPGYIGAMVVAALVRNLDDATGVVGLAHATITDLGSVALSLFIVFALMTLRLWEVVALALPLLVILAAQVAVMVAICIGVIFRLMGRDYEAAVMTGGFCGFMLGTTANAMANMESLAARYGPAPRAFLVVPPVGAFLIDFSNALIITLFVNLLR